MSAMATVQKDEQGRLAQTVPCGQCGYNLRGLLPDGSCPECNASIAISLADGRLALANPNWLRKLARGPDLILGGFAIGLVMLFVLAIIEEFMMRRYPSERLIAIIAWVMGIVPGLVIAAGCWLMTEPESGRSDATELSPRRIARLGAIATVAAALMTGPSYLVAPMLGGAVYLAGVVAVTAAGFAALIYGRQLALRIPNRSLAIWTRILFICYSVLFVLFFTGLITGIVIEAIDSGPSGSVVDGVIWITMLLLAIGFLAGVVLSFICAIATIAMMIWYRVAFHRIARQAGAFDAGKSV